MENGARYVVTTHWGTFSLDAASYQDYLEGKLWISWVQGKRCTSDPVLDGGNPPNISNRALLLREQADKSGVIEALQQLGADDTLIPYSTRLDDISIDEITLTVRSSNGLKRANAGCFSRVRELLLSDKGVRSVRNLGEKSAIEIETLFYQECYSRLLPYEKAEYWQKVLDSLIAR